MRQLFSYVALGALAVAAIACERPAASIAASRSGEFRVLIPARPLTLNPNLELDEIAHVVGRNVFNHLLTLNETGRVLPDLAEAWAVSPDGLTYTFTLRRGVRWHDGRPFSSADVKWTFETVAIDGAARDVFTPVAAIENPDNDTVVIRLKSPWAPFASDLAGLGLAILPRHLYEGKDWRTHEANFAPIGTGSFKFAHWDRGDTVRLEANADYFRSGPYVERLTFTAVRPEEIADRLQRGEADYSVTRPPSSTPGAPPLEGLVLRALPTSARLYVAFNLRRTPFSDVRVRRALASAVDRLEMVRDVLGGLGAPAVGWYTPDVEWAYNPDVRVPAYDREAARRLLDEAGLRSKGGTRFQMTVTVPNTPPIREIAVLLQKHLGEVGVKLAIERVPTNEWPRRVILHHDFDLSILSGPQGPDPDALRRRFLADSDTGAYIGYDDPEFRDVLSRGARAVDLAERAAAYYRAQELLSRDIPFIPLVDTAKVIVHGRRVSGLPQLEARGLVGAFDFSLVKLAATAATVTP